MANTNFSESTPLIIGESTSDIVSPHYAGFGKSLCHFSIQTAANSKYTVEVVATEEIVLNVYGSNSYGSKLPAYNIEYTYGENGTVSATFNSYSFSTKMYFTVGGAGVVNETIRPDIPFTIVVKEKQGTKFGNAIPLTLEQLHNDTLTPIDQFRYFELNTEIGKVYSVETLSPHNLYGRLYNAANNNSQIDADSNSGEGDNPKVTFKATLPKYYFVAQGFNSITEATHYNILFKEPVVEEITIDKEIGTIYTDSRNQVNYTIEPTDLQKFINPIIQSSDESVATASQVGSNNLRVYGVSAGTVTITITSPDGLLSDSITVTIKDLPDLPTKGSGTVEEPYLIATIQDLNGVRADLTAHYKQVANIDLKDIEWVPIGLMPNYTYYDSFIGSYDGNNFKISNLSIDRPSDDYIGLFGDAEFGSVFKNMTFINPQLFGYGEVGPIAGSCNGSIIENCHVKGGHITAEWYAGGLTGADWYWSDGFEPQMIKCTTSCDVTSIKGEAGGLAGWCGVGSLIEKCSTSGTITGPEYAGGLLSWAQENTIVRNCYSTSDVLWRPDYDAGGYYSHGGLVGYADASTILNCYASGRITSSDNSNDMTGGIVGEVSGDGPIISSYYDSEISGLLDTGNGEPRTTEQMKKQATFIDWDFANIWSIRENETYPYFATKSTGQLQAMPLTSITVVN